MNCSLCLESINDLLLLSCFHKICQQCWIINKKCPSCGNSSDDSIIIDNHHHEDKIYNLDIISQQLRDKFILFLPSLYLIQPSVINSPKKYSEYSSCFLKGLCLQYLCILSFPLILILFLRRTLLIDVLKVSNLSAISF